MHADDSSNPNIAVERPMRVLVVDDERSCGEMLAELLASWGHYGEQVGSGAEALSLLRKGNLFDVVLSDLLMPEMTGNQLLREIKASHATIEVILMTGYGTVPSAVDAMRLGAHDYITKPINSDELKIILERIRRTRQLTEEVQNLKLELCKEFTGGAHAAIVGSSPAIRQIAQTIQHLSRTKTTVLVHGESGTGKELVARAIHYSGITATGPFLAVNCGGMSPSLLESQLFGHMKGAFTSAYRNTKGYFREANGGTLLLDEITEMGADLQAKLLRVLQEREVTPIGSIESTEVDLRIIATTNRSPLEAIREGRLREDLYYRLSVVTIEVPPLRDRLGDIPQLVHYFNNRFSQTYGVSPMRFEADMLKRLMEYDWPGNIRELENILARAFALSEKEVCLPDDFLTEDSFRRQGLPTDSVRDFITLGKDGYLPSVPEAEKVLMASALKQAGKGNNQKAREVLRSIQQLECVLARAFGLTTASSNRVIETKDSEHRTDMTPSEHRDPQFSSGNNGRLPTIDESEKDLLARAMSQARGVKSYAAKILRLDVRRLSRMLKKHGLDKYGQ